MHQVDEDQKYDWDFEPDQWDQKRASQQESVIDQVVVSDELELMVAHEEEVMRPHKREALIGLSSQVPPKKAEKRDFEENGEGSDDEGGNVVLALDGGNQKLTEGEGA